MGQLPKKVITILLICSLFSCASKKTQTTSLTKVDTVYISTQVSKSPEVLDRLVLEQVCDTVTKEVIRFKKTFSFYGDTLSILTNENNELIISNKKKEKIIDSISSVYKASASNINNTTEIVRYRTSFWMLAASFVLGAILCFLTLKKIL